MKNLPKLIEFVLMAIFIALTGKGLLFGITLGILVGVIKLIANLALEPSKQIESPLSSIAIGGLSGLMVVLISAIL